mmetsp:Transcript_13068/g.37678  ORF Transcript_13068/g.37678 Transcript_13068/m.37678 type:complete len:350 (+) Transcript_13068:3190-4239(+)
MKRDTKRSVPPSSVLVDFLGAVFLDFLRVLASAHDDLRSTLHDLDVLAGAVLDEMSHRVLVDRVERNELLQGVVFLDEMAVGVRLEQHHVNGLLRDGVGRQSTVLEHILNGELASRVTGGNIDRQLVQGQGSRLVRAQNVHARHLLDCRHTRDDGPVLCELECTQGQCHGENGGHGNGNTSNDNDEDVGQDRAVSVSSIARVIIHAETDAELDDDPDANGQQAHSTNLGHDLLDVGNVVGLPQQRSGPSKEGVHTRGVDNAVALSLLDGRTGEADVSGELLHRKRLSCQRRLVTLERRLALGRAVSLVKHLDVGRNDVSKTDDNNVSRHEVLRLNRDRLAVAKHLGLRR